MEVSFKLYTWYFSLALYRQVLVWQSWNYIVETKMLRECGLISCEFVS